MKCSSFLKLTDKKSIRLYSSFIMSLALFKAISAVYNAIFVTVLSDIIYSNKKKLLKCIYENI